MNNATEDTENKTKKPQSQKNNANNEKYVCAYASPLLLDWINVHRASFTQT